MDPASLSSISLLGSGEQVQDAGPAFSPVSCSEAIPSGLLRSTQGLLLEEGTLRTRTVLSATWQENDLQPAQQLLLRDHSPLGPAAVFALTVQGDGPSGEAPAHTPGPAARLRGGFAFKERSMLASNVVTPREPEALPGFATAL